MSTRRKPPHAVRYCTPVSSERQARLERRYSRDPMRRWTEETGIADRLLELIVIQVRAREGLPTDPCTWKIIRMDDD